MTNKITIQENKSVKHTVVWHDENYSKISQWKYAYTCHQGVTNPVEVRELPNALGGFILYKDKGFGEIGEHIATALPPLPRFLTENDKELLHLYGHYEIDVYGKYLTGVGVGVFHFTNSTLDTLLMLLKYKSIKITGAVNKRTGEKVEIAIIDRGAQEDVD